MKQISSKVLYIDSTFTAKSADGDSDEIYIEGYASTNSVDRDGDVILASAWKTGLTNYEKNPIILAYHDKKQPIGRAVEWRVDEAKGLWVKAKISKAAGNVYNLVKEGILTAFSVGFMIKDADYDSRVELFIIKEVELAEISVVPIPANADSLFSLAKSLSESELTELKSKYKKPSNGAKELPNSSEGIKNKDWNMDPKEIEEMLRQAAEKAAAAALAAAEKAAQEKAAAEAAAAAEKAAAEKAAAEAVRKATEEGIVLGKSGAEKLLADATKAAEAALEGQVAELKKLQTVLTEKAEELEKMHRAAGGKMEFRDKSAEPVSYEEKENAVLLAKILGRPITSTKYGKSMVEKAGPHLPSGAAGDKWELEVSLTMENEVRRRLVVAPLFRAINMQTNVMTFPLNPEAGLGQWVQNSQFGTTDSSGNTGNHQLKEVTLNAYKVATREYMNFEEEEDSLLVLLPIIRDAMVRRLARTVDRAFLMGAGSGADPVRGVALYDASSVVTPSVTGAATIANLRALRKDLGAWGLDPSELVYVVSTEIYYDLLDDTNFQTNDKVGDRATLLTGQIGMIANTPVLVSAEFPAKAAGAANATTNIGAICVAPGNFLAGNQRGLRFDTQDLVETQRRVLVASLRTGMTQVTTNNGMGVSTLRWAT